MKSEKTRWMKLRRGQRKKKKGERSGGKEVIWRREKFPECQDRQLLPRVLRIASLSMLHSAIHHILTSIRAIAGSSSLAVLSMAR